MVESGPFIEYCCELYIHHDLVNAIIAAVMIFATVLVFVSFYLIYTFLQKRQLEG